MNQLKRIQYNCRYATFLIEKKQIKRLTIREGVELKIHLAGCSVCKIFQQQSIVINKMVKNLISKKEQSSFVELDASYKKELQKRIEAELKK